MANSYVVGKLEAFALMDDAASPSTRVEVHDVHSDTSANFRQVPDRDTDPDDATIFSSFRSVMSLAAADIDNFSQAETWLTGYTPVKMVGVTPDLFYQWYKATRIVPREKLTPAEAALVQGEYAMTRDAGDRSSHGVYVTRNGLLHLAPVGANGQLAGGWADTDSNNTPDGYTETSLVSTAWNSGVYEGFVDTASGTGSLNATIPFGLDGVDVTLSVQVDQVHGDGNQAIRIEALDASGSTITGGISDVTYSSTGRKNATLTTPDGTHSLKVYPVRVTSVTANNSKFKIQDPCLRRGSATSYVAK